MKFLPTLRPIAFLGLACALTACSTPANRRELYNTMGANGPWHDYSRRLDASAETGVAPGDMGKPASDLTSTNPNTGPINNTTGATVIRNGRRTAVPKSSPLSTDTTQTPSETVPTPGAAPGAPATVPVVPAVPSSPTTTDPGAPAAPGGATTAPPADNNPVPANPPTT